jgi:hypothetical protein
LPKAWQKYSKIGCIGTVYEYHAGLKNPQGGAFLIAPCLYWCETHDGMQNWNRRWRGSSGEFYEVDGRIKPLGFRHILAVEAD